MRQALLHAPASQASLPKRRALGLVLAFGLGAVFWLGVAAQHQLLWLRLSPGVTERFVADRVATPLPPLAKVDSLVQLCNTPPPWWANYWRKALRAHLAGCAASPEQLLATERAGQAAAHYTGIIQGQLAAAQAWLQAFDADAPTIRSKLASELQDSARAPGAGTIAAIGDLGIAALGRIGFKIEKSPREDVGRRDDAQRTAQAIRTRLGRTHAQLAQVLALPVAERARALGLMAAGLQLGADFEASPPTPTLQTDRASLADALEWQRRAQAYQLRGADFAQWRALPLGIAVGSMVLALAAALASRGRFWVVCVWLAFGLLLGLGALILTDLAFTGDPGQRYLLERQFMHLPWGDAPMPPLIHIRFAGQALGASVWWPLAAAAVGVLLFGLARHGHSAWLRLTGLPAWLHAGRVSAGWRAQFGMAGVFALAASITALLAPLVGGAALVSDVLIAVGAFALATYFAQRAPAANTGLRASLQECAAVFLGSAAACAWLYAKGDLGHLLVVVAMTGSFMLFVNHVWVRRATVAAALLGAAALGASLWAGYWVAPLDLLVTWLPGHAQERMAAMFDPFHVEASDLARVQWVMASSGADAPGWGPGYVPWQGLSPTTRAQDALPLQAPSDYVLSLTTALWGANAGLALMAATLAVYSVAAGIGLHASLRPGAAPVLRLLSGFGAFGCIAMAAKGVLSMGGVAGVLPLTGLPVSPLGYGPTTLFFSLVYLSLALGLAQLHSALPERGVNLSARKPATGRARHMALVSGLCVLGGLAVLLAVAWGKLHAAAGQQPQTHVSQARLTLAEALSNALLAPSPDADANPEDLALPCPQLGAAVAAWNQRLASLALPVRPAQGATGAANSTTQLVLSIPTLLQLHPVSGDRACRKLANALGHGVDTELPRLLGSAALRAPGAKAAGLGDDKATDKARLSPFERPRVVGARALDFTTANAWWGLPGCAVPADAARSGATHSTTACSDSSARHSVLGEMPLDYWLQRDFEPQVEVALRHRAAQRTVNHRVVPSGPTLGVTLVPALQRDAQLVADCFTARKQGAVCEPIMPARATWRESFGTNGASPRAGALGLVLSEVDSGRVVAMAGAISDCALRNLRRRAQAAANGKLPALLDGSPCAQLPDAGAAYLAQQQPSLWQVPPGSSIKPLALAAAIDAGLIAESDDARWRGILAKSEDGASVQRMALAAGQRYLNTLAGAGFGAGQDELLWGLGPKAAPSTMSTATPITTPGGTRWRIETRVGTQGLRATNLGFDDSVRMANEQKSGVNLSLRYGRKADEEYLAARKLASSVLGGADVRESAVGLNDIWRRLDRRARGHATSPALHLLEQLGTAPQEVPVDFVSPQAARRALAMSTGVTASAIGGSAQGACRDVFGACPAQGLPGLAGKTGTADFLADERGSPWVKPGGQIPSKVFGGVFTAANGKRYAITAMALRVREGQSKTLELQSSAPAEAALALMRSMGISPR